MNLKIWAALAVAAFFVIAAGWQIVNVRGIRARGRRRGSGDRQQQERASDRKVLSRPEKKMFKDSQKLIAQSKFVPAAHILEQLSMQREAIQLLEDHGFIHDAAKILMRMQRHNRAGVVYARHGMWDHAGQCFKMANMPLEVAKCAREGGHMDVAAEYYEMAERPAEAAECYEATKDYLRAARLFAQAGMMERAMAAYGLLAKSVEHPGLLEFDDTELRQMIDYLGSGSIDAGVAAVLTHRGKMKDVILTLLGKGMTKSASDLLSTAGDLGPQLMAEVNDQTPSAVALAEVFMAGAQFLYGGMMYERMGAFNRAAQAFEKAGDPGRAVYCYERAGNAAKADALRGLGHQSPKAPVKGRDQPASSPKVAATSRPSFALNEVTGTLHDDTAGDLSLKTRGNADETTLMEPLPQREELVLPPPQIKVAPLKPVAAVVPAPPAFVRLEPGRGALQKSNFCADLDVDQCNKLWDIGRSCEFRAGETILNYNDEPAGIYVIIVGSVGCYKQIGGKESYIDQMGESESFGELWLLADQPTSVHFVATTTTELRVIERAAFNNLLDKDGTIARKLYKRFTARLLHRLLKANNPRKNLAAS